MNAARIRASRILILMLTTLATVPGMGQSLTEAIKELAKLTASDGSTNDQFGLGVDISGNTAVVGAFMNDAVENNAGAAYVFERNQGGLDSWGQVAKLTASDAAPGRANGIGDNFGVSVAIDGDTIVVGAFRAIPSGTDSGAAYIYERNAGGSNKWGEVKKLVASDGAQGDFFGLSVTICGDTVVVGAQDANGQTPDSGAVYVFERNAGGVNNWGETAKIFASDGAPGDRFHVVALDGDTLAVGASLDNGLAGAAYIYERNLGGADNWGERAKLIASDASGGDELGAAINIYIDTVIVGSRGNDDAGNNSGSAYVFERNQGGTDNWGEVKKLLSSDLAAGDFFGVSVGLSGDVAVVGSFIDDDACPSDPNCNSGSAYIFERNAGGTNNWGEVLKLTASDTAAGDNFGRAARIDGLTILIGTTQDADLGSNSGSAYVFGFESPSLSIPEAIPAGFGDPVQVPVSFAGSTFGIAAAAFSVDFDETCLTFDPIDADSDGFPDAVSFSVPPDFITGVTFDQTDLDGELDFFLADQFAPLATLPDATLATITFTTACEPTNGMSILAPMSFSADPSVSYGDDLGRSVSGSSSDGSVEVLSGVRGDCNADDAVDAADFSACALEIFDGDGSFWADAQNGSFAGSAVGCDSNADQVIDAGDMSCKTLLIFNGPGACAPATGQTRSPLAETDHPELFVLLPSDNTMDPVEIAVYFDPGEKSITSIAFSLDLPPGLRLDPTDNNADGLPDSIAVSSPPGVFVSSAFDPEDRDGELDVIVVSASSPVLESENPLLRIELLPVGKHPPDRFGRKKREPLLFSTEPAISFGSIDGHSIPGRARIASQK